MELLTELDGIQQKYGYLPRGEIFALAEKSGVPPAELAGRASFYEYFYFEPVHPEPERPPEYPVRRRGVLLTRQDTDPYAALRQARRAPETVIPRLREAGLLGRSGGAYPAADKWELTKNAPGDEKFVVCNADEGEPFTGKDLALLRENPEAVICGMAICAAAVGAAQGYIYLRGEYAFLRESLGSAIAAAPLGGFDIKVCMGHGAYECGEETALLSSIEGRRGESRLKPPFPGERGLFGKPTVINNVETFACVPYILELGPGLFRRRGAEDYPGTKLYTVSGAVRRPGVYELPSGVTAGELFRLAGGDESRLAAVLCGGGSGGFLRPEKALDMELTPRGCSARGAVFGTAALRFVEKKEELLPLTLELTRFFAKESCGVCTPCRVGLMRLSELLEKAARAGLMQEERQLIAELAAYLRSQSRCGLGKGAATPVQTLMESFPEVLL